jgi:hypothetical protein
MRIVATKRTAGSRVVEGKHIVLPGATKEQLKAIPEFVYR